MRAFIFRRNFFPRSNFRLPTPRLRYSTATAGTLPPRSTVDAEEVDHFSSLAKIWWDDEGPMKPLHSMNRLRVPWIRDSLLRVRGASSSLTRPLTGFRILDVGCGAGFLSEPLARLGAEVVGIDPSVENIRVAEEHAAKRNEDVAFGQRLVYRSKTVEDLVVELSESGGGGRFDAVVASEVVEHVSSPDVFVENCLRLTKPAGGCLFFTTINRTELSRYLAVYAAEYLLNLVPRGTHEWRKFVPPDDLQFMLEKNNDCHVRLVHGMMYNPLTNSWYWIRNQSINYAMFAVKM